MPQIMIVPTGQRFAADPHENVLAAALRAGLNLPHSCKGGHCASCLTAGWPEGTRRHALGVGAVREEPWASSLIFAHNSAA
jgi:hypothetical protein